MKNKVLVVSVLLFSSLCSALNTPRGYEKKPKPLHKGVARIRGEEAGKGALAIDDRMDSALPKQVKKQIRKDRKAKADAQLNKLHRDTMQKIKKHRAAVKIQTAVRSTQTSHPKASAKGRAGSSSAVTGDLVLDRADTTLSAV